MFIMFSNALLFQYKFSLETEHNTVTKFDLSPFELIKGKRCLMNYNTDNNVFLNIGVINFKTIVGKNLKF